MKDKVVVVTGASSGIGLAVAEAFGNEGSKLVLAARNAERLKEACSSFVARGIPVQQVICDVSIRSDCERLIREAVAAYGRIDVLVNNAGISMRALFSEVDLEVLKRLMDTNFWGAVYCTHYALPYLLKSKGSLVGISSIAGKKGLPGRTGYSASKFALEGFLETVRTECLYQGLHVLVACPGFTRSNIRQTALSADGRQQGESPREEQSMMQPGDVARAIYKAVSHRRRDLVLTAGGKFTVWMNKFFPGWMDRIVYRHMAKEPGSPFR